MREGWWRVPSRDPVAGVSGLLIPLGCAHNLLCPSLRGQEGPTAMCVWGVMARVRVLPSLFSPSVLRCPLFN